MLISAEVTWVNWSAYESPVARTRAHLEAEPPEGVEHRAADADAGRYYVTPGTDADAGRYYVTPGKVEASSDAKAGRYYVTPETTNA